MPNTTPSAPSTTRTGQAHRGGGGLLGQAVLRAQLAEGLPAPRVDLRGQQGEAITDLRPIGRVLVAGAAHDARATGWIPRGSRVRVIDAKGHELVVEAVA